MKIYIVILVLIMLMFWTSQNKENFKSANSLDIPQTGIINQKSYKKQPLIKKIKSLPKQKFLFQSDQFISPLTDEEKRLITTYLKRHFETFLEIVRIKKEQQQDVRRYDIVFQIKDTNKNAYNHVVMTKLVIKDGKIFFNTIEYGGMVLPNELPSKQNEGEDLFFVNQSSNKITFLDKQIEKELNKFEKRKIEILLRRGRKAS